MKKWISLVCVIALTLALLPGISLPASAAETSGKCGDDATWSLSNSGVLTISGSGPIYDYIYSAYGKPAPWRKHSKNINSIVIKPGITYIGENAFCGLSKVTSVSLPGTVTSIAKAAFCDDEKLERITIPNSVTTIGDSVFQKCYALSYVKLSSNLTVLSEEAFAGCTSLTEITIPSSLTYLDNSLFDNCVSLQKVILPNTLTSIGDKAFYFCMALKSINIPDSVTEIGFNSFYNCHSLTKVTIPEGVTTIEAKAFECCYGLRSITIPASVTEIGVKVFRDCFSLNTISVSKDNPRYYSTVRGVLYDKIESRVLRAPYALSGKYNIPDGTKIISQYAFQECPGLTSVTIPGSVTEIEGSSFYNNENLTGIKFEGDAPFLAVRCFNGITTTVYYPADNKTWTEEIMTPHGEDITWVPYAPQETVPGDLDESGAVTREDVLILLLHVSMPTAFPISIPADYTGDDQITRDDVLQLLLHISMPDTFPL